MYIPLQDVMNFHVQHAVKVFKTRVTLSAIKESTQTHVVSNALCVNYL